MAVSSPIFFAAGLVFFTIFSSSFIVGVEGQGNNVLVGVFNNSQCVEFLTGTPLVFTSGVCTLYPGKSSYAKFTAVAGDTITYMTGCNSSQCDFCFGSIGTNGTGSCLGIDGNPTTLWEIQSASLTGGFYSNASCNFPVAAPMLVTSGSCATNVLGGLVIYYVGTDYVILSADCASGCATCVANGVVPLDSCEFLPQQSLFGMVTVTGSTTQTASNSGLSSAGISSAGTLESFWSPTLLL